MNVDSVFLGLIPLVSVLAFIETVMSAASVYVLSRHLSIRYTKGVVSAFMVSLCVFLFYFSAQGIIFIIWIMTSLDLRIPAPGIIWLTLAFCHIGLSISMGFMGYFIITKRFDLYITTIKKEDLPKEE